MSLKGKIKRINVNSSLGFMRTKPQEILRLPKKVATHPASTPAPPQQMHSVDSCGCMHSCHGHVQITLRHRPAEKGVVGEKSNTADEMSCCQCSRSASLCSSWMPVLAPRNTAASPGHVWNEIQPWTIFISTVWELLRLVLSLGSFSRDIMDTVKSTA